MMNDLNKLKELLPTLNPSTEEISIGPAGYLQFLKNVGCGVAGGFTTYSSPVTPESVYDLDKATSLPANLYLFGDDGQGYAYGFVGDNETVVEVSPIEDELDEAFPSFEIFLNEVVIAGLEGT